MAPLDGASATLSALTPLVKPVDALDNRLRRIIANEETSEVSKKFGNLGGLLDR